VGHKLKTVELNGVHGHFRAFADDLITQQIQKFGAHTRNEIALVLDQIREGSTCVDLGAHIGTFSVAIGRKVGPRGRVLSLEGDEDTFSLLEHNMKVNGLADQVVTLRAIAGDGQPRSLARHDMPGNTGGGYYAPDAEATVIPTDNTADLFEQNGFGAPDFIKIDIEGMEAIVLRNLSNILGKSLPVLYIEIAPDQLARFGDSPQMIEKQLHALGYRFFRNKGQRNSHNDAYRLEEIDTLISDDKLFDLLALPPKHESLQS